MLRRGMLSSAASRDKAASSSPRLERAVPPQLKRQHTPVEYPLYWVNVLRGRVTKRMLTSLSAALTSQDDRFVRRFIRMHGIASLFEVHENLFWRCFYAKTGSAAVNVSLNIEMMQECGRCVEIILGRSGGMRAFMKGSKNVMTAHVEQLIVTLGSEDQEVRRSALACLRCVLSHIQSLDEKLALKRQRTAAKRPQQAKNGVSMSEKATGKKEEKEKTKKKVRAKIEIRAREIAQIVCEALVSLQILLEEVSLLSAIVRVIKEAKGETAVEVQTNGLFLINFELAFAENRQERNRRRIGLIMAGVEQVIESIEQQKGETEQPLLEEEVRRWREGGSATSEQEDEFEERPNNEEAAVTQRKEKAKKEKTKTKNEKKKDGRKKEKRMNSHLGDSMYAPTEVVADDDRTRVVDVYSLVDVGEVSVSEDSHSGRSAELSDDSASDTDKEDQEPNTQQRDVRESDIYGLTTAAGTTASAYVEVEENDSSPPMTRGMNNAEGVVPNSYYVEVNEDDEGCDDEALPLKSEAKSETRNECEGPAVGRYAGAGETQRTEIEVYEQSDDGGSSNYQEMDFAPVSMLQPAKTKGKAKQKKTKKTKPPRPSPLPFAFSSSPASSSPSPSTPSAIPVPPPPPPPLTLIALSASSHSSGRRAAIQESVDDGDIYHYMKKQQQTKGSMIVRPQDRQSYLQDQRSLQTQHDLRALAQPIKKGELFMWSVRVKVDPKTGIPTPQTVFDSVNISVDENQVTISDKILDTYSAQSLAKINKVSEHFQSFADDDMKQKLNDYYHAAPISMAIELTDIVRVREFRANRGVGWEGKFGFTIKYKANKDKKPEMVSLATNSYEDQQWWIRAIIINRGMSRDWNEEFQMVMKSHREELLTPRGRFVDVGELARQDHFVSAPFNPILLAGKSKPSAKIGDLVHQFTVIAEVLAQIIVDELPQPDAKKLIPPVNLGGVAGGAKYISHGILFKFAIDSAQLYGGDEFAMKATQHEIKGLTAYINYSLNSRFPNTLHFPLMTVIDYKGYRLSATSILPVGSNTIVYGSADGGKTLHNKYKEMNALMKKAGRALNIKSHYVVPVVPPELLKTARRVPICGPGDIEGHRGKDNRFYVLDTARVFPPTTPTPGVRGGFLFQLFRPEFVRGYHLPLCSDAFSRWGHDPMNTDVLRGHNAEVREATKHLLDAVIPRFARRLDRFFRLVYAPLTEQRMWRLAAEDSRLIVIDMHRAGINLRCLGHLRKHVTEPTLRRWLLMEMVSRVLKNKLRELMRAAVRSVGERDTKRVVGAFLHRLLHHPRFWHQSLSSEHAAGSSPDSPLASASSSSSPIPCPALREELDIKKALLTRYPCSLTPDEEGKEWDLKQAMNLGVVFGRVTALAGLKFSEEFEARLWRWVNSNGEEEAPSVEATQDAVVQIAPSISQLPLVSLFNAKKAERHAERSFASIKKHQEIYLNRARDEYLAGLAMKSDDCDILLKLASVLDRLAEVVRERLPEYRREGEEQESEAVVRIERLRRLAERQYQEALRIDSTQADVLAEYAAYLSRDPDRAQEAFEYFSLAVQANPFNQDLEKKHKAFIEQRVQQLNARQQQEQDNNGVPAARGSGGSLATSGGEKSMMRLVRRSRRLTVGTLKGVTTIGGKGLATSSSLLRMDDSSVAGSDVFISAPQLKRDQPQSQHQHQQQKQEEGEEEEDKKAGLRSQLSQSGGAIGSQVSPRGTSDDSDEERRGAASRTSPKRRSLSSSASGLLGGLRPFVGKEEKKRKTKKKQKLKS